MKFKKLLALTLAAVTVFSFTACSSGKSGSGAAGKSSAAKSASGSAQSASSGKTIELKAGHVLTEDSPYHIALTQWADEVNKKTDGRIKIDVFANSVLGNERDMVEALQMGTLDITLPNSAVLSNFTSTFKVFDLPFLFEDRKDAYDVIDSDIGKNMLKSLDDMGVVGLSMWENGFRYIANNKKEINTPSDMKGLKIRTMENPIHMAAFSAYGADPTSMAWGEVYTALQQKTIDGLENPFTPIYQNKLNEVAPYITMTGHFYCPAPLLISKKAWSSISDSDKQIILDLSDKYKDVERKLCVESDEKYKEEMTKEGAKIVENVDKKAWREASQPVYDKYSAEIGTDLIKQIEDITSKN